MAHLKENFAIDTVCLIAEHGRKYNGDTIRRRLHIDALFVTIMNLHQFTLARTSALQLLLRLESEFKGSGESIAFQQGDGSDECFTVLYTCAR